MGGYIIFREEQNLNNIKRLIQWELSPIYDEDEAFALIKTMQSNQKNYYSIGYFTKPYYVMNAQILTTPCIIKSHNLPKDTDLRKLVREQLPNAFIVEDPYIWESYKGESTVVFILDKYELLDIARILHKLYSLYPFFVPVKPGSPIKYLIRPTKAFILSHKNLNDEIEKSNINPHWIVQGKSWGEFLLE